MILFLIRNTKSVVKMLLILTMPHVAAEPLAEKGGGKQDGAIRLVLHDIPIEKKKCDGIKGGRLADLSYYSTRLNTWMPWGNGCWIPKEDNWIWIEVKQFKAPEATKTMTVDAGSFVHLRAFKDEFFIPVNKDH